MSIKKAGVCGTGIIGAELATLLAGNGIKTVVVAHSPQGAAACRQRILENLRALEEADKLTAMQSEKILALVQIDNRYCALADASFVFEAALEDLEVKGQIYRKLEEVCADTAIIASTTSAFPPSRLGELVRHPERLLVVHPFQPAHLLPLVELVGGKETSAQALATTHSFLEIQLKRQVVRLNQEVEGFLVNRIAQAMYRECISLLETGIACPAEIDTAVRYAVGMRYASIGLLEYFDAVGFQLEQRIASTVYPTLCNTTQVQSLVQKHLEAGTVGQAAGEGFYIWSEEKIADFKRRRGAPFISLVSWNFPE